MHKIVFDCERMKYTNTGIFHYCLNLGSKLYSAISPGEELTYYMPANVGKPFGEDSKYLPQHSAHKFFMPSLDGYDIWHGTFQGTNYLPIRNRKIKVVLTIHDLNFLYDEHKSGPKKQLYMKSHQQLVDRADAIVCVSEFSKQDVLTHLNVKNKKVFVIYNGTNTLQKPLLTKNTYKPSKPFLFSIGVMHRKKNFHALLPLLQHNDDLELVISGRIDDKDYYRHIMTQAEKLNVIDKINLTGQISEPEKAWYLKNCNAYVCPSKAEGFGLPVAEAMSLGKPVFLSSQPALSEIGGDAAFYFSDFTPERMQEQFIQGMKQYKAMDMKESIKMRSLHFSWSKAAAAYVNVYRSLY